MEDTFKIFKIISECCRNVSKFQSCLPSINSFVGLTSLCTATDGARLWRSVSFASECGRYNVP